MGRSLDAFPLAGMRSSFAVLVLLAAPVAAAAVVPSAIFSGASARPGLQLRSAGAM